MQANTWTNDRPWPVPFLDSFAALLVLLAFCLNALPEQLLTAQDMRESQPSSPLAAATATRLIPLYYARDVATVIASVRGPARLPTRPPSFPRTEQLQSLAEQRWRLQSQRAALLAQVAPPNTLPVNSQPLQAITLVPVPAPHSPSPSVDQDLAKIERDIRLLEQQEQTLRAEAFRDQSPRATAGTPLVAEAGDSGNALDRVQITVVGEGLIHLRGPLEGVNAITRMIHEIDQPVGQVKIGIHVVQLSETEDAAMEGVPGMFERYLGHARQMSRTSQTLFRSALSNVAARYHSFDPSRFEETFFYAPCVRNFHAINGSHAPLSVALLDSRDIVTTLYLAGMANPEVRREILTEFQRLVAAELPRLHKQYQQAIGAMQGPLAPPASLLARLTRSSSRIEADSQAALRPPDFSFTQTMSCLDPFGAQPNSANAVQVATMRFQRAVMALRQAEGGVAAMRNDRLLLACTGPSRLLHTPIQTASGEVLDAASFGRLADHVIEEQAARAIDLRETVRAEVAALDGQLKRLTTAFEDDLRRQFYKPALEDFRRSSSAWKVRMGQIQTTTIRTNDRTLARVSPGQKAVLDRPVRPVLLQEGLRVAYGLAQEAQSLAQTAGALGATTAVAPGISPGFGQSGLTTVPGQHLGELVGPSERITVSVGDDIAVTPVIQPDGFSVSFHLVYTHTPQRDSDGKTPVSAGVERHMVESDVNLPSLELQEVSRFRVALDVEEQGKGIPLLEDLPGAGALFRPRRTTASVTQENIILVEAVIYPTALSVAGKVWLALDSTPPPPNGAPQMASPTAQGGEMELTGWVLQTLRQQAQASLPQPGYVQRAAHISNEQIPAPPERPLQR